MLKLVNTSLYFAPRILKEYENLWLLTFGETITYASVLINGRWALLNDISVRDSQS